MPTTSRPPTAAALALTFLLAAGSSSAQNRVDAARQASTPGSDAILTDGATTGTGPSELAPKMEGDSEFGVQRIIYRRSNWEPFSVNFDLGAYYTSNVALVDQGAEDDFFLRSGLRLGWTPQIKGGLFFSTSVGDDIYRYADATFFDFDLLSADAGFIYATPQQGTAFDPLLGDLITYVRYSYYRIADPWNWGDDVFDNHSIVAGFQKTWRISRGHQAYFGVNADWSIDASRPEPQRDEYSAFVGYRIKWTSALESNLSYRAAWYDYEAYGRDDFNQVVALGLTWKFNDWVSLNASVSGTFNNSDINALDYEAFNTGVTLAVQAKW